MSTKSNNTCSCSKPKPSDIYQPKPLSKSKHSQKCVVTSSQTVDSGRDQLRPDKNCHYHSSSSSSDHHSSDHDYTSTSFSLKIDETENDPTVSPCRKISRTDAVVKDSDDPYGDFRQSMVQMILEREIYRKDELKELLNCFLELNSPVHHEIIVRAFMEIWNGGVSAK